MLNAEVTNVTYRKLRGCINNYLENTIKLKKNKCSNSIISVEPKICEIGNATS